MKNKLKENQPLVVFGVFAGAFVLIFTRLFLKMDDGNFLGIALSPDFSYGNFLTQRYFNISGRTINEFLIMFFCRHNIILWKFFVIALLIFIAAFFTKLSTFFKRGNRKKQTQIFCCISMFLMMVSCLNPGVFWLAGSVSYLLPFGALCSVTLPFLIYIYENKFNLPCFLASMLACIFACSQEQGAVCCVALILVFFVCTKINRQKLKPVFTLPLLVSVFFTYYLFSSPGMSNRIEEEAKGFERFTELNAFDKIFMGLSVFFANSFYLSIVLILIFTALLSLALYEKTNHKKLTVIFCGVAGFITVVLNVICCVFEKGLAHMTIRKAFLSGDFSLPQIALIAGGFALLINLLILIFAVTVKDFKIGLPVLICFGAGVCCGIMMGFSSSVFASGQRVFFFSNMFIICGCIILFSALKSSPFLNKIFTVSTAYATLTVIVNIFAFTFFEFPLLG